MANLVLNICFEFFSREDLPFEALFKWHEPDKSPVISNSNHNKIKQMNMNETGETYSKPCTIATTQKISPDKYV